MLVTWLLGSPRSADLSSSTEEPPVIGDGRETRVIPARCITEETLKSPSGGLNKKQIQESRRRRERCTFYKTEELK